MNGIDDFRALIVTCFAAPMEALWESYVQPEVAGGGLVSSEGEVDLRSVRLGDPWYNPARMRAILYEPMSTPGTTVLVTNLEDGWATLANCLATSTPGRHVMIRSVHGEFPIHAMTVWIDRKERRHVHAMKDPRWIFFEKGPSLDFEETSRYRERLTRRRVDRGLLVSYLAALGWNLSAREFWISAKPARYLELGSQQR
jgi:hypothetical protein